MAKADIGPKIGIDGEAEFRRQIQDISTGIKTLGSEMKVVTSEYAQNENSVEALTAKNDVLGATIVQLTEKQKLLHDQMQKSAEAFGQADSRTQKLTQQYNEVTAQLNNTKNAYAANEAQLQKLGNAGEGVMGMLKNGFTSLAETVSGKLGGALGLSSNQMKSLTGAITGSGSSMGGLSTGSLAAAGAIGALGAAAVKGAQELVKLSEEAGRNADAINTLATNYNMSAQEIQQWQYMAKLTDTSVETVTGSISKLTRSMNDARDGTGNAADAFSKLGISVTNGDGSLRSANDVFMQVIDALGQIENATERDALSMEIFGKSAMELNSLIATGSDGIAAYAAEAEKAGYVMSDQMLSSLQAVDDAGVKLDNSLTALHNTLGAAVAPAVAGVKGGFADFVGTLAKGIQNVLGMDNAMQELPNAFDTASSSVSSYADELERAKLAAMSLKEQQDYVWQQMQNAGLGRIQSSYDSSTGHTYSSFEIAQQPAQVNINLNGQTVGSAMVPIIEGNQYLRGDIL